MDWAAIAALTAAGAALVKAFLPAKSSSRSDSEGHQINEEVDATVLGQFLGLTDRVATLEGTLAAVQLELAQTREELRLALIDLAEMQKVEEYLRARLHEKDKELLEMRAEAALKQAEIEKLRGRVKHLEDVCKRAGINGDEEADNELA